MFLIIDESWNLFLFSPWLLAAFLVKQTLKQDGRHDASSIGSCYWKCYLRAKHARFLFMRVSLS
jgi:hypothetical protein